MNCKFKCSLEHAKSHFIVQQIFSKTGRVAPELLSELKAKCLPVLVYGLEAAL